MTLVQSLMQKETPCPVAAVFAQELVAASLSPIRLDSLRVERLEDRQMLAGLFVTSLADNMTTDGLITLREALSAANNDAVADTMVPSQVGSDTDVISFSPSLFSGGSAAIVLTQGQLVIASNLTLQGPGAGLLTIDASGSDGSRVIDVNDGIESNYAAVEIFGITITGGESHR